MRIFNWKRMWRKNWVGNFIWKQCAMFFRTDYLYGRSGSKTKKAEKRNGTMCVRGRSRKNADTKRNAICAMASCFHFHKLDFADASSISNNPSVFLARVRMNLTNQGRVRNSARKNEARKNNLWITASFTVEASLISMTIIMAVFLCVYYGFFLHDKTVLEEVASQAAHKAIFFVTENSDMEDGFFDWESLQKKGLLWRLTQNMTDTGANEYVGKHVSGELFACDMPEFSVESNAGSVRITYRAHIRLPLFSIMRVWGVPSEITGCVQVCESKQEEFIRLIRGILQDKEQD